MSNIHSIVEKRFNNTNKLIFLATSVNNTPYIRAMTPYYHEGSFYFISDINSEKVKHIQINNTVALCGEWFNAQGIASVTSFQLLDKPLTNNIIQNTKSWIELSHIDINSVKTCIIQVEITHGYIVENKTKYEIKKL